MRILPQAGYLLSMEKRHPTPPQTLSLDQPATYHIQVVGRLQAGWSEHFGGLEITTETVENGPSITHLEGVVADQAGLHGLLRSIRDLGLPLLRVECINVERGEKNE